MSYFDIQRYHNFPTERTLLVTHSNQALNQLFEKIMELGTIIIIIKYVYVHRCLIMSHNKISMKGISFDWAMAIPPLKRIKILASTAAWTTCW